MYASTQNPAVQYREIGVSSSIDDNNPAGLVYMLMEGAISRLLAAKGHIERKEMARKGEMLSKATAIIVELQRSLDMDKGGEFSTRMDLIYDYILRQLIKANLHHDTSKIDEVVKLLTPLRDAWKITSDK